MKLCIFSLISLFLLVACSEDSVNTPKKETIEFYIPNNFPTPEYDLSSNPISYDGFVLGRELFYDPILSADNTISCGTCHQQPSGFTQHGHDLSHGINDLLTLRNSQPIQNLAWQKEFAWDGGIFHLDLFPILPITAENEMGETMNNVVSKLNSSPKYKSLFRNAFEDSLITGNSLLKALSQFQLMCISSNSKYDKVMQGVPGVQFTSEEIAGKLIFDNKCASCHSGVFFTDQTYRNNGLPIGNPDDLGRAMISLNQNDNYKFKVPSLRNIEVTRPYMHDGRFRNLKMVLDHYSSGVVDSPTLDPKLKNAGKLGIELTEVEKELIIAFLLTLTDEEFLRNPKLSEFR